MYTYFIFWFVPLKVTIECLQKTYESYGPILFMMFLPPYFGAWQSWFTSLLKIKVLYWIRWFHEEHVTFTLHKSFFKVKIQAKKKRLLRTVDWKVLCGTQKWFFFRITAKPRFGAFLKRVTRISYYIKKKSSFVFRFECYEDFIII